MTQHTRARRPRTIVQLALALSVVVGPSPIRAIDARAEWEWSHPENLGAEVNSAFEELSPHVTSDGLALYFASTRSGTGGEDLWVSRRASRDDPWAQATNLGPALNTAANERSPALSINRRLLFFASDRAGGHGGFDIWLSWRADPDDDAGWQPPQNLGNGINTAVTDAGPSFLDVGAGGRRHHARWRPAIPQLYLASNRTGGPGGLDIHLASVPGGWAGPPMLVAELSSPQADLTPTIRQDGLEIIIASGRAGTLGSFDLFHSFRRSVFEPWSEPTSLGPLINSEFLEVFPSLSFDGRMLLLQSNRPGGFGGSDIYLSRR